MEHHKQHLKNSNFITDPIIGLADGLTVPFASAAGLSAAVSSNNIIVTARIAKNCCRFHRHGFRKLLSRKNRNRAL